MGSKSNLRRLNRLKECAETYFGEKVVDSSAPGGEGRASWRLRMESRSVISTLRPNFRRTHLEAIALKRIYPICQDVPECLGVVGEILFQSDVGGRRLNQEIAKASQSRRIVLAHEAISGIFRIQSAAHVAKLHESMPHLGNNQSWVHNLVEGIDALTPFSEGRNADVDREALFQMIACPARQFVKWDCRSGNAAIDENARLRWFDFEYSGVRHGAEDIAWLLGDEAWPISPDVMLDIVIDAFDGNGAHELDAYLDYLSVYLTLHCVQRLKLIIKEARKRGWLSKTRVRKYDDAGVHPEFAAQICRVGAYFGARCALTTPIGRDFEDAEKVFLEVLRRGSHSADQARLTA